MDFKTAKSVTMPFGKFKGLTLDKIAETDAGLKYLDWLAGQNWLKENLSVPLGVYLKDPAIAESLDRAIRGGQ